MCAFIRQEAKEKVNELQLKTQHDANLESSMLVHKARTKIQKEVTDEEKRLKILVGFFLI
jgi:V-type H+-transporting ATPase subunit E